MRILQKMAALFILWAAAVSYCQTKTQNIGLQVPTYSSPNWHIPVNFNSQMIDLYLGGVTPFPHSLTGPGFNATSGYQINGSYGLPGQCIISSGTGSIWGTCANGGQYDAALSGSVPFLNTLKGPGFDASSGFKINGEYGEYGQCLISTGASSVWGSCNNALIKTPSPGALIPQHSNVLTEAVFGALHIYRLVCGVNVFHVTGDGPWWIQMPAQHCPAYAINEGPATLTVDSIIAGAWCVNPMLSPGKTIQAPGIIPPGRGLFFYNYRDNNICKGIWQSTVADNWFYGGFRAALWSEPEVPQEYEYSQFPVNTTPSGAFILLSYPVQHVTGTEAISTIFPNHQESTGCVDLIPDDLWTTVTGGNIAVPSTAIVGRVLRECYDGSMWYPSY